MQYEELTGKIIGCAMKVHSTLGPGFLESIYRKALAHELRKSGLKVELQWPIEVTYDGLNVGNFFADLFVEDCVIVELKAVQNTATIHEVQLVNYLAATAIDVGLLFNFGTTTLEYKRKHRVYKPKNLEPRSQSGQD